MNKETIVNQSGIINRLMNWLSNEKRVPSPRFQKFADREYIMEHNLSKGLVKAVHYAKMNVNRKQGIIWKGATLSKDPFSLCMYSQLLQELKPRTIIEIGAWEGASAKWFYDILKALDISSKIYSYDISLDNIKIKDTDDINFSIMDSNNIEKTMILPDEIERPLLFIEDAHVNINGVLEFINPIIKKGDYVIVEDTMERIALEGVYADLTKFMQNHDKDYLVDSFYTDMFGYNVTWHWNGIFRKIR